MRVYIKHRDLTILDDLQVSMRTADDASGQNDNLFFASNKADCVAAFRLARHSGSVAFVPTSPFRVECDYGRNLALPVVVTSIRFILLGILRLRACPFNVDRNQVPIWIPRLSGI